jgi:hypothetical protein
MMKMSNSATCHLFSLPLAGILVCCSSAPAKRPGASAKPSGAEEKPAAAHEDELQGRIEQLLRECRTNPDVCEEAMALNRPRDLDRAQKACDRGDWSSCGYLYRSGPDGRARLQGEGRPLRWFRGPTEVQGRGAGGTVEVSVFDGTPVFLVDQKGTMVQLVFPDVRFVTGESSVMPARFEVPVTRLSSEPRKLRLPTARGRRALGFERALSPAPGKAAYVMTDCGQLHVIDELRRGGKRYQRVSQIIDGVRITGWTSDPIDHDLGPCYPEGALVYQSDAPPSSTTRPLDAEKVSREFEAIWRPGFEFYYYGGEGAACIRHQVNDDGGVSEWTEDGYRDIWRVERYSIHLIFLGPTIAQRTSSTPAYAGTSLYTVLSVTPESIGVTGGAERGERITAFRPELARYWWRSKETCERERAEHPHLPPLTKKEIKSFGEHDQ